MTKLKFDELIVYNNQKKEIISVLNRFQKIYKNIYNFEVIIVDNASKKENKLDNNIIDNYFFDIKYYFLKVHLILYYIFNFEKINL